MDIRTLINTGKLSSITNPKKDLLDKIELFLEKCCDIYYNTDNEPPLTDEEFDRLHKWFSKFRKFSTTTKPRSGKKTIDISHMYPQLVGTLDKVYNITEFEEWLESKGIPDSLEISMVVSYKEDGNSVTDSCGKDGKTQLVLTRGKDGKGVDLTKYFKHISFPTITNKSEFGVKCEAIMTKNDFEEYNAIYEKLNGKRLANSRSAVAGILGSDEGYKYSKFIKLVPLSINFLKIDVTREEELKIIDGFNNMSNDIEPLQYKIFRGTKKEIVKQIDEYYNYVIREVRDNLNRPIDGLVIEFLNNKIRKNLGRSNDRNNYDVALKFPYLEKRTKVKEMKYYLGKTNRVTPVCVFEDVVFNGAVCNHVSLSNYKRFKELNLGKGDEILVQYVGDVLSYIPCKLEDKAKDKFKFITTCPSCGGKLSKNKTETFVFCKNSNCPNLLQGKIVNWLTKIDVKGIKENTIEKIINAGYLNSIEDLYSLNVKDLITIDGFQEGLANNVVNAINGKKEIYDYELLGSLMIENFSRKSAKLLCKEYGIKEIFLHLKDGSLKRRIIDLNGFEEITANYILHGLKDNFNTIKALLKIMTIKPSKVKIKEGATLYKIVFTGFRNKDLQQQLESLGHTITSSVSKNTDIVVAKDVNGSSSSLVKARTLGKEILDLEGLKNKLGLS